MNDLLKNGYMVVKNILTEELAAECAIESDKLAEKQVEYLATGAIPLEGVFLKLITWEPTLHILKDAGFDPRFYSATFINKKPHEPKRPWHQDWWYWPDPVSTRDIPCQLGVMYYFRGSYRHNGCLKVIPGSHKKWHVVHDDYFNGNVTMSNYPEEVAVEMGPTDVLFMDARLLHSTYENTTDANRLAVNLWHILKPTELLPEVQTRCASSTAGLDRVLPGSFLVQKTITPAVVLTNDTYHPIRSQLE